MGFRFNIATKQITITRGDSGKVQFRVRFDGIPYEMQDGDRIYFGVKKAYTDTECIVEKEYIENPFILSFDPEDTKSLDFGTYIWDMQFVSAAGYTNTFIKKKNFTVTEEVV